MNNEDLVKEWFRFAEMDLKTAEHLNKTMHPKPLEIICYHTQQSAEKALKGFLISADIEAPKTHDLQLLCDKCTAKNAAFNQIYDACETLTVYGVQPRYPYEVDVTEDDCNKALKYANELMRFVSERTI